MNTELYNEAIEMLKSDDELFVEVVNELDWYNGFADGYRAYPMSELDDIFYGTKLSDFLAQITPSFNLQDDYFFFSIYGVDSTDDIVDLYRSYNTEDEVLNAVLETYPHIRFYFTDFQELIDKLVDSFTTE